MNTMRTLTDQLPDRDEILRAIGLQVARPESSILSTLAVFAAGLAIGAGVAYILTNELSGNGASRDDDEEEAPGAAAS
jgi:hypothetical protein